MLVSVEEAQRLFDEESEPAIFSAEVGPGPFRDLKVNVYPRKDATDHVNDGYIYCLWGPGVSVVGLDAIKGGGVTELTLREAVDEAIGALIDTFKEGR